MYKGLISKIYKQPPEINNRRKTEIFKWALHKRRYLNIQ